MKTVLIADDQRSVRLVVNAAIASDAYSIVEAADGNQAWDLIQQRRPNVALLDVQMPGRTGLELTRAIKGDPNLAGTLVFLLTANMTEDDIAAGMAAGADLYLTKPFSPLELVTSLEKALGLT